VHAESVASYLQHHVDYRHRVQQLWEHAQGYSAQAPSPTLARLRNRYHLQSDFSPEHWRTGPGRLVGAARVSQIEATFVPGCLQPGDRPGTHYRVGERIFQGKGWEDVLLMPSRRPLKEVITASAGEPVIHQTGAGTLMG
jgi:hypothetical protein